MPRLRIKLKETYKDVPITGKVFVIGRADQCDYPIPSGYVSRHHCEIRLEPEGYVIRDMGSKMGTWLNGKALGKQLVPLNMGDTIKLANRLEAVFMADVTMMHTETLAAQKQSLQRDQERLVAVNGPLAGREFPLYLNLTRIGRADDNHIAIPVDTVSSYHAEITREAEGYVLRDLESGNGTFVGEQRIKLHHLQPGDLFLIDWVSFRFEEVHYRMESEGTRLHGKIDFAPPESFLEAPGSLDIPIDRSLIMEDRPVRMTERLAVAREAKKSEKQVKKSSRIGLILGLLLLCTTGLLGAAWAFWYFYFQSHPLF